MTGSGGKEYSLNNKLKYASKITNHTAEQVRL